MDKLRSTFYECNNFKHSHVTKYFDFLYIFIRCDTTYCFFNQGKFRLLNATPKILKLIDNCYDSNSAQEEITKSDVGYKKSTAIF